jgi:voltage-gated potassium channel
MAQDDRIVSVGISHRGWLGAMSFTALVILLVAAGVTGSFGFETLVVLIAVFGAAGLFLWMFPGSRFFVLAFANSLALYTTVFFFLRQVNFGTAAQWSVDAGYLLPIYAFLAGVWMRRSEIRGLSRGEELHRARLTGRKFVWLVPIFVIGAMTFAVPGRGLDPSATSILLVGAMAVIAVFVAAVSRQICLFLIDTGLLFDSFFVRASRLFRPAFAFFTLYTFIVIVFAMIFRIMDKGASSPIFVIDGTPGPIGFADSLYFSLITMSTVGYGDITPAGEAVRVVAAIEILLGILLFLFGFAEIMRFVRERDGGGEDDA